MKKQMPGWLAKVDDPYGITWRVANLVRRISMRRTARFIRGYIRNPQYQRPVFILGVPRSGTTMLFHLLSASNELGSMGREGHDMWRMYHHPRYSGWQSDAVGHGEVKPGERRFVKAFLYSYVGDQRFVEKTPENSLRVPYLLDLFPDALFVVLKRNPCNVINSLINGWRHPEGRYRSYFVPQELEIPDYLHRRQWCFALIEGWRDYTDAPISDIAFAQWEQCTKALLSACDLVPASQWTELYFEDLLEHPDTTMACVYEAIGIESEPALEAKLAELLAHPVNALSSPGRNKWRRQNSGEIESLLPKVAPIAAEAGYLVNPSNGKFEIAE